MNFMWWKNMVGRIAMTTHKIIINICNLKNNCITYIRLLILE